MAQNVPKNFTVIEIKKSCHNVAHFHDLRQKSDRQHMEVLLSFVVTAVCNFNNLNFRKKKKKKKVRIL